MIVLRNAPTPGEGMFRTPNIGLLNRGPFYTGLGDVISDDSEFP